MYVRCLFIFIFFCKAAVYLQLYIIVTIFGYRYTFKVYVYILFFFIFQFFRRIDLFLVKWSGCKSVNERQNCSGIHEPASVIVALRNTVWTKRAYGTARTTAGACRTQHTRHVDRASTGILPSSQHECDGIAKILDILSYVSRILHGRLYTTRSVDIYTDTVCIPSPAKGFRVFILTPFYHNTVP